MVYLEGDFFILVQKHAELADAYPEVSIGEFVRNIEAQGTKFSPFKSHTVEHTQREQEELEFCDLYTYTYTIVEQHLIHTVVGVS